MKRMLFLTIVAVAGAAAAPAGGRHLSATDTATVTAVTAVTVTMTDMKFQLSRSRVTTGTVVFTLINKGKVAHDLRIAGKKSPLVRPGKRATFRVVIRRAGRYAFVCTVPGHSAAGMKGVLTVSPPTRVTASMTEMKFRLSKTKVPIGTTIFTLRNQGIVAHDLKIAGKKSATIQPGRTGTLSVAISKPGRYPYLCTLPGHAIAGMKGVLTVTR